MNKKLLFIFFIFILGCTEEVQEDDFCGVSTNGECSKDSDCVTGGCSGQVCQSAKEGKTTTICDYKECYDSSEKVCGCIEGKCNWN